MTETKIKKALISLSKPFLPLIEAFKNCWDEIWKSVFVMAAITIILATVFYRVESPHQMEYSDWWHDVVWAFCVYIEDPGGIGGNGPVTQTGKVIATILGFLNILIVAVPAGIIASGFTAALEKQSKEKKFALDCAKLRKSFKPILCRHTLLRVVPPFKSVTSLQVKLGLTEDEIIGAVEYSQNDDLRLRNYADTYSRDAEVIDRLIVEYFPIVGSKKYGSYKKRSSNVTIVCTSSYDHTEIADSHFGYILAEMGGFNFMSREFDLDNGSYYNLPKDMTYDGNEWHNPSRRLTPEFQQFFSDLRSLSEGKDKWIIFLLCVNRRINTQVCFVSNRKNNDKIESTVIDTQTFNTAYTEIAEMLDNHDYPINEAEKEIDQESPISADLNTSHKPVTKTNISAALGGGSRCNVFTIRMASSLLARDRRDIPVALRMAEIFRKNFDGDNSYITQHINDWKKKGINYNNFG